MRDVSTIIAPVLLIAPDTSNVKPGEVVPIPTFPFVVNIFPIVFELNTLDIPVSILSVPVVIPPADILLIVIFVALKFAIVAVVNVAVAELIFVTVFVIKFPTDKLENIPLVADNEPVEIDVLANKVLVAIPVKFNVLELILV